MRRGRKAEMGKRKVERCECGRQSLSCTLCARLAGAPPVYEVVEG